MFDDMTLCLLNECYEDSLKGEYHLLSVLEGAYIERLKSLSQSGLLELRKPFPLAKHYGVSFEVKLTSKGLDSYRACQVL